jgi:hypothetical protein
MTHCTLDALNDAYGRGALWDAIEKARAIHGPVKMTHTLRGPDGTTTFHELCVPLARDGEHADMVLFASYAEKAK